MIILKLTVSEVIFENYDNIIKAGASEVNIWKLWRCKSNGHRI